MKNLFTTIFATAALLVANNAWAEDTPIWSIDFSSIATTTDGTIKNFTAVTDYTKVGQEGWNWNSQKAEDVGENIAFARTRTDSKTYGFCFRYSALFCQNNPYAMTIIGMKKDYEITVVASANGITGSFIGTLGAESSASASEDNKTFTYLMSADGDLNLMVAGGAYVYSVSVVKKDVSNNASYTVKYVCGEDEIKTSVTHSGAIGEAASLLSSDTESFFSADNSKKYIYMSDDSANKTISSDGSTVVTVTFKEAGVGNVNVIAKDKEGNTLKTFTETRIEGDDATNLYYTRGIKANDNYYFVAGSFINGVNYGVSMIYGSEDTEIEYALDEDVVYYAEESELNLSRSFAAQGMVPERASGGNWQRLYKNSYAYTSTLNAGTYSIVVAGRNQNSSDGILVIKVRDAEGNILDSYSQELTWAGSSYSAESATNIDVPEGGSIVIANTDETYNSNVGLDYVIVSYATTTYTIKYVNTDNEEIQTAVVDNIYVGETFTASDDQMANIIYQESDYGYLSGNEEKTAVADAEQNVITLVYKKATVTAVDSVKANAEAGAIYTLGGVKVTNPTQGLYIQDGKLIRVK
ncbi:MAG: hypothetical protein IKR17_12135 [Bacteroidales bacterium]|nr:hypothetical protein [Bacteroidales bacterium]